MKKKIDIKQLRFYLWTSLAYFLLWLLIDLTHSSYSFPGTAINSIWLLVYILVLNYLFFEYALPVASRRKSTLVKILLICLLFFVQMMLFSYGFYRWRSAGIALHIYTPLKYFATDHEGINYMAPHGIFSILFFGVSRHIYSHLQLRQATQQLRIEKQQAELNYLRSQTNPHFLFNTLNNIYALARDKSSLAPESILRLSKILRFMLYETGGAFISIEQELRIITDYIALERLRYDDSLRVNFNHDVEDMKQAIPPLLLMPLVENAFKHGVSETRNRPYVDIHLAVNKRQLTFIVKNSTEAYTEEWNIKENIGLSNLRRQLELLYKEYNLSVQQGVSEFTAVLKINLGSHA